MQILEIQDFIENFRLLQDSLKTIRINSDLAKFHGLISGYHALTELSEAYERKLASSYNVFQILKNIYKDEERTHSPYLADLLNCKGSHRQGDLFYTEFIKLLDIEDKSFYQPLSKDLLFVELEKYTGDGSIDILIRYHDNLKYFGIAIENKIYAKDQPKQLERYNHYLKTVFKDNYLLVYLSPDGHAPMIPYSIEETTYKELTKNRKLLIISYKDHIIKMIENAFPKIQAENIRIIIAQYLDIITKF